MELKHFKKIIVITFLRKFFLFTTMFFLPLFLRGVGLTNTQTGIILSLFTIMAIFVMIPFGIYNDIGSSRLWMKIASVMLGVFYLALSLSFFRSFHSIFVLFVFGGISFSLFEVSYRSFLYKIYTHNEITRVMGLLTSAEGFAMILGSLVGSTAIHYASFNFIFYFNSIGYLFLLAIVFFLPLTFISRFSELNYKKDIFEFKTIILFLITLLFTYHWGSEIVSYAQFLKTHLNLDKINIGYFFTITLIPFAPVSLIMYRVLRNNPTRIYKSLLIGLAVSSVTAVIFAMQTDLKMAYFVRFIHEIGDTIFGVAFFTYIPFHFDRKSIGGHSGMVMMLAYFSSFIGSNVSGVIGDTYGNNYSLMIAGYIMMPAFFLILVLFKDNKKIEEKWGKD